MAYSEFDGSSQVPPRGSGKAHLSGYPIKQTEVNGNRTQLIDPLQKEVSSILGIERNREPSAMYTFTVETRQWEREWAVNRKIWFSYILVVAVSVLCIMVSEALKMKSLVP